jgi:hypothetical protein
MSVPSYTGETFVGYLDISGFKQMMNDRERLRSVMDKFYRTMFGAIHEVNSTKEPDSLGKPITKMNAVVVSDCAVLFLSKGRRKKVGQITGLKKMLRFIKYANMEFIDNNPPFMTTCSIAYGDFEYQDRKDWRRVRKNCMSGQAYIDAYLDGNLEKSRIRPGQCRLLRKGLSPELVQILGTIEAREHEYLNLLNRSGGYYYFYWMLKDESRIQRFKKEYKRKFDHMYDDLIELLQNS